MFNVRKEKEFRRASVTIYLKIVKNYNKMTKINAKAVIQHFIQTMEYVKVALSTASYVHPQLIVKNVEC